MRMHPTTIRPAIPLLGVGLLVFVCGGCRAGSNGKPMGPATPATFESARSGPHRVGHAPGTCDLCDLYYKARAHVVLVRTNAGLGAGIVVTASGRILTNAHVADDDLAPVAETYGGDSLDSRVLRSDAELDLALLQAAESTVHWEPVTIDPPPTGSRQRRVRHRPSRRIGMDRDPRGGLRDAQGRRSRSDTAHPDRRCDFTGQFGRAVAGSRRPFARCRFIETRWTRD